MGTLPCVWKASERHEEGRKEGITERHRRWISVYRFCLRGKWGVSATDEVKEMPPAESAGFPGRK